MEQQQFNEGKEESEIRDDVNKQKEQFLNNWEENIYETLDNSIILHKPTLEFLIKKREWDALILFLFYCYCSKLQRNSKKIWVSNGFSAKNLKWRKQRILKARKVLADFGIIEATPYKEKSSKSGGLVIKKWFIEIKPLLNAQNIFNKVQEVSQNKTSEVPKEKNLRGSQYTHVSFGNHSSIVITSKEFNSNNIILHSKSDTFAGGKDVNYILNLFNEYNLSLKKLFNNTTERKAAAELLERFGKEKLERFIQRLPQINAIPYMPVSTKPTELLRNLPKIFARLKQLKQQKRSEKVNIEI